MSASEASSMQLICSKAILQSFLVGQHKASVCSQLRKLLNKLYY